MGLIDRDTLMVNGATSRTLYLGAFILLGLCLIGIMSLSALDRSVPNEISIAMSSLMAFIIGAHVKPPTMQDPQVRDNQSDIARLGRRVDDQEAAAFGRRSTDRASL